MILGIGTDLVEISRFEKWYLYSKRQQRKVFSESEISQYQIYVEKGLSHQAATFLASRYAAKEAFYKALCVAHHTLCGVNFPYGFMFIAQHIEIESNGISVPHIQGFERLFETLFLKICKKTLFVYLSLSHEKNQALAFVVIAQ